MKLKPSPACRMLPAVGDEALRAFMESYFIDGYIRLRPPQNNVRRDPGAVCVVLFREGQFQVELVIVEPHTNIPQHCHDDVQSYEIAMAGELEFFVSGMQSGFFRAPNQDGLSRDLGKYVPVPSNAFHGGRTGPSGACFLSVQHWREGVAPTHVILNWRGPKMGEL